MLSNWLTRLAATPALMFRWKGPGLGVTLLSVNGFFDKPAKMERRLFVVAVVKAGSLGASLASEIGGPVWVEWSSPGLKVSKLNGDVSLWPEVEPDS